MHLFLHRLIADFSLPADAAARLWRLSGLHEPGPALGKTLERGLAVVATLLLGVGLVFWVAANWQDQTRQFKFLLLQGLLAGSFVAALLWQRARMPLLLLVMLAMGGMLAFVGQTYQTGADPWQLFAVWAGLALLCVVAGRSDVLWSFWVLIAGLGIALWSGDRLFDPLGDALSHLWRHRYLHYITPVLWALLVLAMLVVNWRMPGPDGKKSPYALVMAVLLALCAWVTYGSWGLFSRDFASYFFNSALVGVTAFLAYAANPRHFTVLALSTLALDVLFLSGAFKVLFLHGSSHDTLGGIFMFGALAAACVGLTGSWLYKLQSAEKTHE
ncbi:MAG: DUF2157 domain-containing protein [Pseudomonadota bacterium]